MRFLFIIFLCTNAWANAQATEWVRVKLWSETSDTFSIEGSIHRLQGMESVFKNVALPQVQKLSLHFERKGHQGRWVVEGFKNYPLVFQEKFLAIEGLHLLINHKKVPEKIILSSRFLQNRILSLWNHLK